MWEDRNTQVHGSTIKKQQERLCQCTIKKVITLSKENPYLAPQYPMIKEVLLECCLQHSTKNLQEWSAKVEYQKVMMEYMLAVNMTTQMTIHEAFLKAKQYKGALNKYPP